jgi:aspartate/methionine/tyrosine aminotransferase
MSQPVAVPGISAALFVAGRLFLDEGEKFVSTNFRWGNVNNIFIRHLGTQIVPFPLFDGDRFNTQGMKEALLSISGPGEKVLLLLNLPNNPAGFSPLESEAEQIKEALVEAAQKSGKWVVVLLDDAYEGYVYEEDCLQTSLFGLLTGAHPRLLVVKLDGVSKELLFYGGRVGAVTFGLPQGMPEEITQEVKGELEAKVAALARSTFSSTPRAPQALAARVLEAREDFLKERQAVIEVLKGRYRTLKEALQHLNSPTLRPLPFNSGFFAFLKLEGIGASDFAEHLITKYKVAVIPLEGQGVNGIRVAFCGVEAEILPRLVECISEATRDLAR